MALRPGYFVRRALRNMRQSPMLSLASVGTVALAFALLAFFAIAVLNVQQMAGDWSESQIVVAYLDKTPSEKDRQKWQKELATFPEVSHVDFVSSKLAMQRFRERLGENADLLEGLAPDILPSSFELKLKDEHSTRESVDGVVKRLQKEQKFSDLQYGQEWRDKFEAFLFLLRVSAAALGGFLLFAALVIVANTIKLTLYVRQDELEAMAMVGGTSLFIKLPYLVEGLLQGLLGGGVALGLSFLVFRVVLQESLGTLLLITGIDHIYFLPGSWQLLLVAGGGGIGLLGSLFALRKFVRIGPA